MTATVTLKDSRLRLVMEDITLLDTEAFVFYARPDLKLGSGFGTAVSMRGGPSIQEALDAHDGAEVTDVVVTKAGKLKAERIFHAVGPAFQEEGIHDKLRATIVNTLKAAEDLGVKRIAFPAMGAGFYGVPLPESAEITLTAIADRLAGGSSLEEVVVCLLDHRELDAFQARLDDLKR